MVKKIILGFFITSLIMIGVFGLVGCDDDPLKSYKDLGKTEIQTYADAKGQDSYSADDWAIICNIVATGKAAVDAAESNTDVNTVINDTKNAIDEMKIARDDGLNYEIRSEIINWSYLYLDLGQNNGVTREDIDSWWIDHYYGQYNGFHIFHFRVWGFGLESEMVIDSLSFRSRGTLEILAVKENCGMTLKELYEYGYITHTDLEEIYIIHSN